MGFQKRGKGVVTINITGPQASGKTLTAEELASHLRQQGYRVVTRQEEPREADTRGRQRLKKELDEADYYIRDLT